MLYVTNRDGSYTQTNSDGWDAENVVLEQAWEEIDSQLEQALKQVKDGKLSPIGYYIIKNRMDIGILAAFTTNLQKSINHKKGAELVIKINILNVARLVI